MSRPLRLRAVGRPPSDRSRPGLHSTKLRAPPHEFAVADILADMPSFGQKPQNSHNATHQALIICQCCDCASIRPEERKMSDNRCRIIQGLLGRGAHYERGELLVPPCGCVMFLYSKHTRYYIIHSELPALGYLLPNRDPSSIYVQY